MHRHGNFSNNAYSDALIKHKPEKVKKKSVHSNRNDILPNSWRSYSMTDLKNKQELHGHVHSKLPFKTKRPCYKTLPSNSTHKHKIRQKPVCKSNINVHATLIKSECGQCMDVTMAATKVGRSATERFGMPNLIQLLYF